MGAVVEQALACSLAANIVLSKIPLDYPLLFYRQIDHVGARGRVMAGEGVFPMRLSCADGFEEVRDVSDRRIRTFVLDLLRGLHRTILHLSRNHFWILIISLGEFARPAVSNPAIVFPDIFRVNRDAGASDRKSAFRTEHLKSCFPGKLVVE